MDSRICIPDPPPWRWITPRPYIDPDYIKHKADAIKRIAYRYPFMSESNVKLVRVVSESLDMTADIGIYYGMKWSEFKNHLMIFFEKHQDKLQFNLKDIQDVTITNNPYDMAPCIDDHVYDLFTVIPDNVAVFFSQIKVGDMWHFIK